MDFDWDESALESRKKSTSLHLRLSRVGIKRKFAKEEVEKCPDPVPCNTTETRKGTTYFQRDKLKDANSESGSSICVGEDCAGLGTGMFALEMLGLKHRAQATFMSESDDTTRSVYVANHGTPKRVYTSCLPEHRTVSTVPKVDLYICGPPCPPYSIAGKRKGLNDTGTAANPGNRSNPLLACLHYIIHRKPVTFIMEQVAGITQGDQREIFNSIESTMADIQHRGGPFYHVESKVLNTKNFGIPQNRERVFLVGVQKSKMKTESLNWPTPVPMPFLTAFLGANNLDAWTPDTETHLRNLVYWYEYQPAKNLKHVQHVIDLSASSRFECCMKEICPTLTRSRCAANALYLTKWQRRITTQEMLRLQGFSPAIRKSSATDRQIRAMVGNAISVPVIAAVIRMVLHAADFAPIEDMANPVLLPRP
jgi:DNA (cytosine-5)-methyltransferase 1